MHSISEPAEPPQAYNGSEAGRLADEAIIRSLCYAGIFNFALTLKEIVRFAPGVKISPDEAAQRLKSSEALKTVVKQQGDLYYLAGKEDSCRERLLKVKNSKERLKVALKHLTPLQGIPFVRAAAITGALAAFNSPAGDDIDLLIITKRRRTWTAYFSLRLWRHFGHRPDICFNVFLAERDLIFRNQNLFYAREILGAIPILNNGVYDRFVEANPWINDIFPSYLEDAERQGYQLQENAVWKKPQRLVERLLKGFAGDLVEMVLRKCQRQLLIKEAPDAAMNMRRNRIQLHKQDNRIPILDKYEDNAAEWLRKYEEAL